MEPSGAFWNRGAVPSLEKLSSEAWEMCAHFLKKSLLQAFQKEESGDGNTKNVVKEVGMWPWVPRGPQPESPGSREGAPGLSAWALQPDLVLLRSCWEDVHRTDLGKSHTHSSAQRAEGTCERHTLWGSRGKRKVPRYVVGLSVGSWLLLFICASRSLLAAPPALWVPQGPIRTQRS